MLNRPILYTFRRCPYAMRARLALAASGQQCQLREIALKNKPAELLKAWPGGTVPVLVFPPESGAATLVHSLDIMLWALAQNDPLGWLQPEQGCKAEMLALVAWFDTGFKPLLDRYKYPNRFADEWVGVQALSAAEFGLNYRQQGAALLANLEMLLRNQSLRHPPNSAKTPWLYGHQASLADMAVLPFVRQYADTDRLWFDAQAGWPHLVQWLLRWEQSTIYSQIMQKTPLWLPGTSGIIFPVN